MLFLVTAIAAVMLMCGCRTQLAAGACWLLLVSLHTRNPIVINAGDKYLELLAFWGIFLPLGAYWSVDARSEPNARGTRTMSLAALALHVQVLLVYLSTGLLKQQIESWQTGDAIRLALSKSYLVSGWGQRLLEYPALIEWLTHVTLYGEIFGPLALLASRGWLRLLVVAAFMLFHLALALCFTIGLFPYVCLVALVAFLPTPLWSKLLRNAPDSSMHVERPVSLVWFVTSRAVMSVALLVAIWSNLTSLGHVRELPEPLLSAARAFRWPQSWRLFVDLDEVDDGWFVFHAQFADGRSEDLLTGRSPVSYHQPRLASRTFPNFRWRKLCTNIRLQKFRPVATYLGEYLLLERDRTHRDVHELVGLQISYVKPRSGGESIAEPGLEVLGVTFEAPLPLEQEVLYQWRNDALKYRDIFLTE